MAGRRACGERGGRREVSLDGGAEVLALARRRAGDGARVAYDAGVQERKRTRCRMGAGVLGQDGVCCLQASVYLAVEAALLELLGPGRLHAVVAG